MGKRAYEHKREEENKSPVNFSILIHSMVMNDIGGIVAALAASEQHIRLTCG